MKRIALLVIALFSYCSLISFAQQEESPLPGATAGQSGTGEHPADSITPTLNSAPLPGQAELNNQVVSKEALAGITNKEKQNLPLSIEELKSAVEDMKTKSADNEPEAHLLNNYLVWVDWLIKAHNKLAGAFAKQEDFQAACETERDMCKRLYYIKDQFLYLKAEAMIKKNKWAEALPILVEITASQPKSSLGQAAYLSLKQAGFSPEAKQIVGPDMAAKKNSTEKLSGKPITLSKPSMHKYLTAGHPKNKQ